MDLNIMLWMGGMLFSLGIFAVKVGLGLGSGRFGGKGVALWLTGYTALFMGIAVAAERLMKTAAPLLQKGPWTHGLLAFGLIVWGLAVIRRDTRSHEGSRTDDTAIIQGAPLLMIIPCPVCLSAMTFSTWAALNAIHQPPLLLGLCLGLAFSGMALLVAMLFKARTGAMPKTSLGLAMIVVGLYFVFSLFLPAKIEAARGMYASFLSESQLPTGHDATGTLVFIIVLLVAGFFAGTNVRSKK
ncbi:MAG: transporter-like protein [uncultured bacterium]|nr:MAG: transporter-like protein [uncultured bacterium]